MEQENIRKIDLQEIEKRVESYVLTRKLQKGIRIMVTAFQLRCLLSIANISD
jgi:hypothetical protein